MKTPRFTAGSIAALLTILALSSCSLQSDEDKTDTAPLHMRGVPDDPNVRAVYDWYVSQGQDPCDPPPDPWHPFVTHGLCPAGIERQ